MGERYANKRTLFRKAGRFSKPPALGAETCKNCGQIVLPEQKNMGSEEFPLMKAVFPSDCPSCKKPLGAKHD